MRFRLSDHLYWLQTRECVYSIGDSVKEERQGTLVAKNPGRGVEGVTKRPLFSAVVGPRRRPIREVSQWKDSDHLSLLVQFHGLPKELIRTAATKVPDYGPLCRTLPEKQKQRPTRQTLAPRLSIRTQYEGHHHYLVVGQRLNIPPA